MLCPHSSVIRLGAQILPDPCPRRQGHDGAPALCRTNENKQQAPTSPASSNRLPMHHNRLTGPAFGYWVLGICHGGGLRGCHAASGGWVVPMVVW